MATSINPAPGGPGDLPTWTRADKDGVGTAHSWASPVWFTVAGGIITEVYYPDVDTPQVRDFQLIITDGSTFFHDAQSDFTHQCDLIDPQAMALRLTNSAIGQPYSVIQEVIAEPDAPCLLVRTTLQGQQAFLDTLRVYVLLAPHLGGAGSANSGKVLRTRQGDRLVASRGNYSLALGADCGFAMTSCGFVGVNDGWTDIVKNGRLPIWNYDSADDGNIAFTAEVNRAGRDQFVLALAFCTVEESDAPQNPALVGLSEALSYPFDDAAAPYAHLQQFINDWRGAIKAPFVPVANTTGDADRLFQLSRNVLLAHEDKTYSGAFVASLSIPWGLFNGDKDAGYHLVWPRDMCQSATALLAAGELDEPLRALMYLAVSQSVDGSFSQNFFIDGRPNWQGIQLDEYSFPVILAYRLNQAGALQLFDPKAMVLAAAGALIANGPMTQEERWEENEGYSPSTLASNIAAFLCAADLAETNWRDAATARFLREYADFLESHLEAWCVTTQGELLPDVPQHYIRLLPTQVKGNQPNPALPEDPNTASIILKNPDGRKFPARNVVDGGFLELVRYGIRSANDRIILDTVKVIDAVLKDDLPGGVCFRRYNHDGYGQGNNGEPYNNSSTGVGRSWPLLTGERGHFELAAGHDARPYIRHMESFAGSRGLLAEQLWNMPDLTSTPPLINGGPTGSSMPLAWAHAEYIKLVRSVSDGRVFDRLDIVANRYLVPHEPSSLEIWNFDRQLQTMQASKRLRIPLKIAFSLRWSVDNWSTFTDTQSVETAVGIYYVDLPTNQNDAGSLVQFTFYWTDSQRWEGENYSVRLSLR